MNGSRARTVRWSRIKKIAGEVFRQSRQNEVGLLAAGLGFFAMLSLAPLLLIAAYVVGIVVGQEAARSAILGSLRQVFEPRTVELIATMIEGASRSGDGPGAAIFGGIFSIVIGSRVFVNIQKALNALWGVDTHRVGKLSKPWPMIRKRLVATAFVIFVSIVFLASILAQTALAAVSALAEDWMPASTPLWNAAHNVVIALVASGVFAILYKVLPDVDVQWRWVRRPAVVAAVSYVLVSAAIGRYLGYEGLTSMTGAAGAVMALMLWVLISAAVFLVGAQTCRVLAEADGYRPDQRPGIRPAPPE